MIQLAKLHLPGSTLKTMCLSPSYQDKKYISFVLAKILSEVALVEYNVLSGFSI